MPAKDDKVFDVAKPNETTPTSTSRPVIVGHKPMAGDPMVKSEETKADSQESAKTEEKVTVQKGKTLTPSAEAAEEIAAEKTKEEAVAAPASPMTPGAVEGLPEDASDEAKAEEEKKRAEAEEKERQERERLEKLIESKKYYVPIGETRKKKAAHLVVLLLVLILLLLGAYAAADAGYIELPFKLPYDFIQN